MSEKWKKYNKIVLIEHFYRNIVPMKVIPNLLKRLTSNVSNDKAAYV